jgi:hypothetical protein
LFKIVFIAVLGIIKQTVLKNLLAAAAAVVAFGPVGTARSGNGQGIHGRKRRNDEDRDMREKKEQYAAVVVSGTP